MVYNPLFPMNRLEIFPILLVTTNDGAVDTAPYRLIPRAPLIRIKSLIRNIKSPFKQKDQTLSLVFLFKWWWM